MKEYQSVEEIKHLVPEMMVEDNLGTPERIISVMNLQIGEKEEANFVDTCNYFQKHIRNHYHCNFIATYAYLLENEKETATYSNKEKLLLAVPFLEDDISKHPLLRNKKIINGLSQIIPEESLSSIDQIFTIFDRIEEKSENYEGDNFEQDLLKEISNYNYQELKEAWNINEYPTGDILEAVHQMNPKL